jgi:hypothetical protein
MEIFFPITIYSFKKGSKPFCGEIYNMNEIKQPEMAIYSTAPLSTMLIDTRMGLYGQQFGTIERVCHQYGIKCIQHPNYTEFIAPKSRLTLFMEKLHFSRTKYSKKPL